MQQQLRAHHLRVCEDGTLFAHLTTFVVRAFFLNHYVLFLNEEVIRVN